MEDLSAIIGILIAAVALFFFGPMIGFGLSYVTGWICKVTFGPTLCHGLNTLFNVTYFAPDKIPLMAGALGWVGGFFKSINYPKTK